MRLGKGKCDKPGKEKSQQVQDIGRKKKCNEPKLGLLRSQDFFFAIILHISKVG